jgi:hypothetical protein
VLSSLGPIVAFFSVSTTTYQFMLLVNVAAFGLAGLLGLTFLLRTLERLSAAAHGPAADEEGASASSPGGPEETLAALEPPSALDRLELHVLGPNVKTVFRCWVILFGLVGAQMGWVMRPFIGKPGLPFVWFRGRESNFFEAVWRAFVDLLS